VSLATLLEAIDADPPVAVLCWNVMPVAKMLLVDGLLDVPMFDVSPGEMYFASLERYFARPHPLVPIRTAREYGARLAGVIVKYEAEAARAREILGAPVQVVPNGVPLTASSPRGVRRSGRVVLGTAARLHPQKRIEDLLSAVRLAASQLPPWTLRIAGGVDHDTDAYVAALRQMAEGLPVEWVDEVADTREFLAGLDVFVMISEPAGCPNASLEAMAAGLPVIATDVGGAAEQIIDGVSGCLVPPRDDAALARSMIRLANDPDLCGRLAAGAWAHVQARFSMERMVAGYSQLCLGEVGARALNLPAPGGGPRMVPGRSA
jgi:glycosyltransferase involved in cell wall biosynthesis